MKTYILRFLQKGMLFGGFGPIVLGIVYLILSMTLPDFSLSGIEVFIAILSTYLLAFLQAGASVFHEIEEFPLMKSLLFHFLTIYLAYVGCYLVNAWIPFDMRVLGVFTTIFIAGYLIIWLIVYTIIRTVTKKMNASLK